MPLTTEMIRRHHRELYAELEALIPEERPEGEPAVDPVAVLHFLREELLPHAVEEEREVYDVIDALSGAPFRVTEPMRLDHVAIGAGVERLASLVQAMESAGEGERAALSRRFWREADRLGAVIRLHFEKEERAYLPLLEQREGAELADAEVLDVREVPPARRHDLIFEMYARLQPGQSFILVNDHAPRPLYYQFQAEHAGELTWEYLEEGPVVWRVRIGRR
ncbi:hypothetical protein HRbin26_00378 [bacterium HR26]|nr:hypothetical protein HRbin26_00378 [bacterium HR26]